jgi:hypothetical protein
MPLALAAPSSSGLLKAHDANSTWRMRRRKTTTRGTVDLTIVFNARCFGMPSSTTALTDTT